MVGMYEFLTPDSLYLLYEFFEHIPDTDITISVSYTVDKWVNQELYVNVSWIELRSTLADLFNTIDGSLTVVVIAGALARYYIPPLDSEETTI